MELEKINWEANHGKILHEYTLYETVKNLPEVLLDSLGVNMNDVSEVTNVSIQSENPDEPRQKDFLLIEYINKKHEKKYLTYYFYTLMIRNLQTQDGQRIANTSITYTTDTFPKIAYFELKGVNPNVSIQFDFGANVLAWVKSEQAYQTFCNFMDRYRSEHGGVIN